MENITDRIEADFIGTLGKIMIYNNNGRHVENQAPGEKRRK